jgi:hypothetical protein
MAELYHGTFGATGGKKTEQTAPEAQKPKMTDIDLRSLIELGCIRDNIVIGDITFTMRSLNISERLETLTFLGESPDAQRLFEFNMRVLAMSVEAANGKQFETFHPRFEEGGEPTALKRELVVAMQPPVLNKLMDFYAEITGRSEAQFSAGQVKNS